MNIRHQIMIYLGNKPGRKGLLGGGLDCKMMIAPFESARHHDLALYLSQPYEDTPELWWYWVPDLVIENVTPGSEERDYVEKREEYLAFGVAEYWIANADRREILALTRRGGVWQEQVIRPLEICRPLRIPKLAFDLARALDE